MHRSLVFFFVCFYTMIYHQIDGSRFNIRSFVNDFESFKSDHIEATCKSENDCPEGFFCKTNDCVAKRSEGDSCLSNIDNECMCGKCLLDPTTWSSICLSNSYCQNGGTTPFNSCESNKDCPENYFCDSMNGKVCTSKLPSGRLCTSDSMCTCGKCIQISQKTRPNKPPITFDVCNSC